MTFRRVERSFGKIHRAGSPERGEKVLVKLSYHCRRLSGGDCRDHAVEGRSRLRGIIPRESGCYLARVGEEPVSLVELVLGNEFTARVDRLRVLLDGDTNDAG